MSKFNKRSHISLELSRYYFIIDQIIHSTQKLKGILKPIRKHPFILATMDKEQSDEFFSAVYSLL
jgi:hypothetical protein